MRKLKVIPFLALLFMLSLVSCSGDDINGNTSDTPSPNQVINNVNNGTWRVTLYNENGTVNTSQFSGYNFTFGGNNAIAAYDGTTLQSGTWNTYNDSGITKMDVQFVAVSGPFESISEDWRVISSTASKMEMQHTSGSSGAIDLLTLEKN